eukprot:8527164-Pyramimonas_sp.AAC.1
MHVPRGCVSAFPTQAAFPTIFGAPAPSTSSVVLVPSSSRALCIFRLALGLRVPQPSTRPHPREWDLSHHQWL